MQLRRDYDSIKTKNNGCRQSGANYIRLSDGDREVLEAHSRAFHEQFEAAINRQSLIAPRGVIVPVSSHASRGFENECVLLQMTFPCVR